MLLIEVNSKSTRRETKFNTATPEFVANRNRITLDNGKELAWVVVGVEEGPKEAAMSVKAYRASHGDRP